MKSPFYAYVLALAWAVLCPSWVQAEVKVVTYGLHGNYKAWMVLPPIPAGEKRPVIIYNYDEAAEKLGPDGVWKIGYDLNEILEKFASWGFVVVMPLRQSRGVASISEAVAWVKRMPQVDLSNIHMIGVSEGAALSLVAAEMDSNINSVSLIAPRWHYTKGVSGFSTLHVRDNKDSFRIFYLACEEGMSALDAQRSVQAKALIEEKRADVVYKNYEEDRKWFRTANDGYLTDLYQFVTQSQSPQPLSDIQATFFPEQTHGQNQDPYQPF